MGLCKPRHVAGQALDECGAYSLRGWRVKPAAWTQRPWSEIPRFKVLLHGGSPADRSRRARGVARRAADAHEVSVSLPALRCLLAPGSSHAKAGRAFRGVVIGHHRHPLAETR